MSAGWQEFIIQAILTSRLKWDHNKSIFMHNKIILITGANAGIGKSTVKGLAQEGAKVIMACRKKEKGDLAKAEIERHYPKAKLEVIECNLASFHSVKNAASQILQSYQHIDVLINNAGLFSSHKKMTEDGVEMQFGVNHLGHFLLTKLLLPLIEKSSYPKIINVSSVAHLHGTIDFDNLKDGKTPYNGLEAYAQSKLANVLFTRGLARKYPNIASHCLHPGVVNTSFGNKYSKWYLSLFWHFWKIFMLSSEQGAATSIHLATSDRLPKGKALFFDEKQKMRSFSDMAKNDILVKKLWDYSEQLIEEV